VRTLLPRERRVIVVGALVCVVAIVVRLTGGTNQRSQRAASSWQREHAALLSERRLIEADERNRATFVRVAEASGAVDSRLVHGRAATTAAMALALTVRRLARDAGLHGLKCVDAGSDSLYGALRLVRVQAEAQGSFDEVADLIRLIESDSLRMRIDDVEVIARPTDGSALPTAEQPNGALQLRLTVAAVASIGRSRTVAKASGVQQ
jgi:hypothetical protein